MATDKRLIVYTALIGLHRDKLQPVIYPVDPSGRNTLNICFTDGCYTDKSWDIRMPVWEHDVSSRRTARWHKVNAHLALEAHDYSLWLDGTHQLLVNPWELVDKYLQAADIAAFKHPQRDCLYQELNACRLLKKDDTKTMVEQVDRYRRLGYPEHAGLLETTAMLRKNTIATREFNTLWWSEIEKGSLRDQLSLPYILCKLGLTASYIPGCRDRSDFFKYTPHKTR